MTFLSAQHKQRQKQQQKQQQQQEGQKSHEVKPSSPRRNKDEPGTTDNKDSKTSSTPSVTDPTAAAAADSRTATRIIRNRLSAQRSRQKNRDRDFYLECRIDALAELKLKLQKMEAELKKESTSNERGKPR
mmetsp:Transcript_8313/g.24994  ORF Transcript_8313/g.24994 Transcript_8313/m.24994 type:complete len:131 (+) Transcript_8313:2200-2592(+)